MDPERQWIARLEPETPEDDEELEVTPLERIGVPAAGGAVALGGLLQALDYIDVELGIVRIVALVVAGIALGLLELIRRRQRARFTAAVRAR